MMPTQTQPSRWNHRVCTHGQDKYGQVNTIIVTGWVMMWMNIPHRLCRFQEATRLVCRVKSAMKCAKTSRQKITMNDLTYLTLSSKTPSHSFGGGSSLKAVALWI